MAILIRLIRTNKNTDAATESIELKDILKKRTRDANGAQLTRAETIPRGQTTARQS
jgi:hypothetical protein